MNGRGTRPLSDAPTLYGWIFRGCATSSSWEPDTHGPNCGALGADRALPGALLAIYSAAILEADQDGGGGGFLSELRGKVRPRGVLQSRDFIAYLRRTGRLNDYVAPGAIILCYQRSVYEHVLRLEAAQRPARGSAFRGIVTLPSTGHRVGLVGEFGVGAPVAAGVIEDFIALGTSRFFSIGTAGSLQRDLPVGATVLCDRAIRDEGVSHHYLPSATYVEAAPGLTQALSQELTARAIPFRRGSSWTIDTPYRETVAEARHYQAEGVLCVEMEAAALMAVAQYRGVEVACAFVMSDSLADLVWDPQFHSEATSAALVTLCEATLATAAAVAG